MLNLGVIGMAVFSLTVLLLHILELTKVSVSERMWAIVGGIGIGSIALTFFGVFKYMWETFSLCHI